MPSNLDFFEIGKRIRELRGKNSRRGFAENFLVAQSSIARWEAGESAPELSFLVMLASAYGVTLEWIITGNNDLPKSGKVLADHQLAYLNKLDWPHMPAGSPSDAGDSEKTATVAGHKCGNKQKNKDICISAPATVAGIGLQEELNSLNKELRDLLRQNGDLRVENAELRARVRDLERELREALTPEKGQTPLASAG